MFRIRTAPINSVQPAILSLAMIVRHACYVLCICNGVENGYYRCE